MEKKYLETIKSIECCWMESSIQGCGLAAKSERETFRVDCTNMRKNIGKMKILLFG